MVFWDEPRKRKAIPKGVRDSVWKMYAGVDKTEGKCYVCGTTITVFNFDVGHNKAKAKGGSDKIDNLRPICRSCNSSMGTMSIETYKAKHYQTGNSEPAAQADKVMLDNVKTYLSQKGYETSSKKRGFDLVGVKETLSEDRYLLVAINDQPTVTQEYVIDFKDKVRKFDKKTSSNLLTSTNVAGLIAHKGKLPEGTAALVKGFKPSIKFEKF